jgi:hypothetical protein
VDTDCKVAQNVATTVIVAGYSGIARYLPLPGNSPKGDIDAAELQGILGTGLALLLVQHVRRPGWSPAKCSGETDALTAVEFAKAAGYAPGAHVFLDLEGIEGTAQDTTTFAEEWAAVVVQTGYRAGCYVGYGVPLDGLQLYNLHHFNSYWSDAGPRSVATRGFAIKQQEPVITLGGVSFDPDILQLDNLNEAPFWMTDEDAQAVS